MSLSSPNTFIVEQQIVRAKLQSGDTKLEKQAQDEIDAFPSLGTVYSLQTKKFTRDEIQEVEKYIAEQKEKYPDSLQGLYELWERMVKSRQDILVFTQEQSLVLSNTVNG